MTGIDPAFGNWLAGFIDGEGSFGINPSNGSTLQPRFSLRVRDDDLAIVEEIVARTGIGTIRLAAPTARDLARMPGTHGTVAWRGVSKRDYRALVELLDAFPLRAKKRRDYEVWRTAVRVQASCRMGMPRLAAQRAQWRLYELKRHLENVRAHPDTAPVLPDDDVDGQLELGL